MHPAALIITPAPMVNIKPRRHNPMPVLILRHNGAQLCGNKLQFISTLPGSARWVSLEFPSQDEYDRGNCLEELTMPAKRSERGVPLPGVWQVCVLVAALAASWIIGSEFRPWITPPDGTAKYDAGENLRAILSLSNDGCSTTSNMEFACKPHWRSGDDQPIAETRYHI
jgi:hypothetical protein